MKKKTINVLIIALVSVFLLGVGASAATTIASTSVIYGDTTVEAALDELMDIANQCPSGALCSKVSIGNYVSMTPTQTTYTIPAALTGYTSDQTINPSELNLWRVIDIKSDGTIEMVSEYVSSTNVYFKGQTGYLNYVGTLNTIASQYGNSTYTIRTRYMGYDGQTVTITDTSKFTNPAPWITSSYGSGHNNQYEKVGGGDTLWTSDFNLVNTIIGTTKAYKTGTTTTTAYWLASRHYVYNSSTDYRFMGRIVYTDGNINSDSLYLYLNGWSHNLSGRAIRPIVTLRSGVTASSGSGTSTSPWILS